ncbi:hypothetical protein FA13DRAFT_1683515 [Coprinellus micaceus]|uniref:Knr4/Smi1-like domain-containing protein n=1 Tax=Coprinellus micaceus TaxID=71717 RepID=A0A4Y7TPS6_COPMI|nr:hypothetical protein FA13DRAFT_1683515 [Coprinellus micaceus]
MDSMHTPLSRYPPLTTTWNRLRSWLNREYPELGDTLNYGIPPQDLADIEMQFGFPLPPAVRESYLVVDGQEAESAAGCAEGLFFGLTFLPLESVLEEWRFWREVDDDPATGANPKLLELMQSIPPGWIRADYANRGWVPLIADKAGNYIGIDLNPGQKGSVGQVIIFGRDFDTKVVLWGGDGPGGWAKWLAAFAEELEAGEGFEIGNNDNSEGDEDEDDIGYESYYHDGSGRGAGDGGGSAGTGGGLKITGEYRGWNVLEAWGDRSLRKWHEAGLLPEYMQSEDTAVTTKPSDTIGLGVGDITNASGAEVAIPVLGDNEPVPPPPIPKMHVTSPSQSTIHRTHAPGMSISKAPAPRPVDLPTPDEFDTSDASLHSVAEDDLEAGRSSHSMREFRDDSGPLSANSVQPYSPLRRETSDSTSSSAIPFSSHSSSPGQQPSQSTSGSPSAPLSSSPIVPDLFDESTPKIRTIPLQPSTSTSSTELNGTLIDTTDSTEPAEPPRRDSPAPNVRLVGGAQMTGVANGDAEEAGGVSQMTDASIADDAVEAAPTSPVPSAALPPASSQSIKRTRVALLARRRLGRKTRRQAQRMPCCSNLCFFPWTPGPVPLGCVRVSLSSFPALTSLLSPAHAVCGRHPLTSF